MSETKLKNTCTPVFVYVCMYNSFPKLKNSVEHWVFFYYFILLSMKFYKKIFKGVNYSTFLCSFCHWLQEKINQSISRYICTYGCVLSQLLFATVTSKLREKTFCVTLRNDHFLPKVDPAFWICFSYAWPNLAEFLLSVVFSKLVVQKLADGYHWIAYLVKIFRKNGVTAINKKK